MDYVGMWLNLYDYHDYKQIPYYATQWPLYQGIL